MSDADVRCLDCEYDLRGLPRDGRCPECGTPVEFAFRRYELLLARGMPPLGMSSPRWLRHLAWGCTLMEAAACGTILAVIARNLVPYTRLNQAVFLPLFLAPLPTFAIGLWRVGTREPAAPDRGRAGRWCLRAGSFVTLLGVVASWQLSLSGRISIDAHWYRIFIEALLMAVVTFVFWRRMGELSRRSGRQFKFLSQLAWLLPAGMLCQAYFFSMLSVAHNSQWMIGSHGVTGAVIAIPVLPLAIARAPRLDLLFWAPMVALTLWSMIMLARMAWLFFREARVASAGGQRTLEEAQPVAAHQP